MLKSIINSTLAVALLAGSQVVMINTAAAATDPAQAWMASLAAKLPGAQVVSPASGVYVLGYVSKPGATLTVGGSWNNEGTGSNSTGTFSYQFPEVNDTGF
jgi:hypothetical protein